MVARSSGPAVDALLPLIVVASAMMVGSVHLPALLVVAGVSTLLALAALHVRVGGWNPPAVLLTTLGVYAALQAVPIPFSLLERIAPHSAEIWARALHPFAEPPPARASASLDPGASATEALKWFVYGAVALGAGAYGRRHGVRRVAAVAFFSALAVAFVTLLHGLVGATRLFGIYAPQAAVSRWGLAPLLNPNNLAGYLNLGAFCGFGLLLAARQLSSRAAYALGVIVCVASSILTASRGGVLAMLVAGMLLAAALVATGVSRRRMRTTNDRLRWALAVLVLGASLAALGVTPAVRDELFEAGFDKLTLALHATPMIADHWVLGVGRGAYESVFPAYDPAGENVVFTHPENFVLQWCAEWGAIVTAPAFVAAVWMSIPMIRLARSSATAACVLAALVSMTVQNLFDLAFEVPAVMVATVTAWAGAWGAAFEKSSNVAAWRRRRYVMGLLPLMAGFVAVALWRPPTVREARRAAYRELRDADLSSPGAFHELSRSLREHMQQHPAEPYFSFLGAVAAGIVADPAALRWFTRAIERRPNSGHMHYALAKELWRRGAQGQALLEVRTALALAPSLDSVAARQLVLWQLSPSEAMRVAAQGAAGARLLVELASAYPADEHRRARLTLAERAVELAPDVASGHLALARELVEASRHGDEQLCPASEGCLPRASSHIERAATLEPSPGEAVWLRARVLALQGRSAEALAMLSKSCPANQYKEQCYAMALELSLEREDVQALAAFADGYLAHACANVARCAAANRHVASSFARLGGHNMALSFYERAARLQPDVGAWLGVARAAHAAQAQAALVSALRKASSMARGNPEQVARVRAERSRLHGEAFSH